RVAAFLLNLMHRLAVRGFSATSLLLRMSRDEIGSFLGLTPETVSRTLSAFQAGGLLVVRQRLIEVNDATGLQRVLDGVLGADAVAVVALEAVAAAQAPACLEQRVVLGEAALDFVEAARAPRQVELRPHRLRRVAVVPRVEPLERRRRVLRRRRELDAAQPGVDVAR